ncbi:hypothetical protein PRNP1_013458 [Phytophthora ramorum]
MTAGTSVVLGFVMKLRLMRSRSTGVETEDASLGVVEATLVVSDSGVGKPSESFLGSNKGGSSSGNCARWCMTPRSSESVSWNMVQRLAGYRAEIASVAETWRV